MPNVLILGLAREGVSLVRYFARQGARVTVTDSAGENELQDRIRAVGDSSVCFVLGGHHAELVAGADALYVSPGVPETNPVYQEARRAGVPVRSMTTLFFERCPGPIVGVTGSSGKTTTTGLIGHILRCAGREAVVGGNIGDPMLDLLDGIGPQTVVVLELSSFQLSLLRQSPHIAVVTNISPNHLDRHGTMADYIAAKRHIVEHQSPGDYAVLNVRDETAPEFARATPAQLRWFGSPAGSMPAGATTLAGQIGLVDGATFTAVMVCADVPLLGRHNVENVLAALAATAVLEIEPEAMAAAVRTYRPAPHRLQPVGDRDGVLYIDDSIATSPARALVALEAIDAPILLIAGGRDKKLPWDEFAEMVVQKARALLLIGESAPIIERAVRARIGATSRLSENAILRCESLWEAVSSASRMAVPGEVVLLSPGCASYDMFRDFEERGTLFIRAVEALNVA